MDIIEMYNSIYLPGTMDFINEVNQLSLETEYSKLILFEPKLLEMYTEFDHSGFLPYFQSEYTTIYSISPISKSSEFLGNKRIRQLTPPPSEKIAVSPFNSKSSFSVSRNSTAFKDLSQAFIKK
jgi:hypothetical protein